MTTSNKLKHEILLETGKCVRCGKCKAVCDMYKYLREEEYSPRGLVMLAENLAKGEIKGNFEISKIFYTCFLCLKCSLKCPLDVNIVKVIILTRGLLWEEKYKRQIFKNLPSTYKVKELKNVLSGKVTEQTHQFYKFAERSKNYSTTSDTILFPGCFPDFKLVELLEKENINFKLDYKIQCCGYLNLAMGDFKRFDEIVIKNKKILKSAQVNAIITGCPHCYSTLNLWYNLTGLKIKFISRDITACPAHVLGTAEEKVTCTGFGGLLDILNPEIFEILKAEGLFKPKCNLAGEIDET